MWDEEGQSIHRAVVTNDLDVVTHLVSSGHSINSFDEAGLTPLHYAVYTNNVEMLIFLAQLGAEINLGTRNKDHTPLHIAAERGNMYCLTALSILGAFLTPLDSTEDGKMPIHTAVKYNQMEAISWFLTKGVPINIKDRKGSTPLFHAIMWGHTDLVPILLTAGADVNVKHSGLQNITPLHMALIHGDMGVILMLLMGGADMSILCNTRLETPVHWAIRRGDVPLLDAMSNFGPILSMEMGDEFGDHPIHLAVREGHLHIIEWLVGKGISVNCTNKKGHTPLHTAVFCKNLAIALYLLQEGSQVYVRTYEPDLFSPLNVAVLTDELDMVDLLIHYGANVNDIHPITGYTSLHYAVIRDNVNSLKHLINKGGNIMVYMGSETRQPLIVTAIKQGSINVVRWLMLTSVPPNTTFEHQRTALHYAAYYGRLDIARLLLQCGTDINCRCQEHWTPLHYATARGDLDMVGFLLLKKADVQAECVAGFNALFWAVMNNEHLCLQLLVTAGGDVTKQMNDASGDFLIHIAVAAGHESMVTWLIRSGLSVNIKSREGMTPLMVASKVGNDGIAKLLLDKGANVNDKVHNCDHTTALHFSCVGGKRALVQLLIERGADVNAGENTFYGTPLQWAIALNRTSILDLLRKFAKNPEK